MLVEGSKTSGLEDEGSGDVVDIEKYLAEQADAVEMWYENLMDHCFAIVDKIYESDSLEHGERAALRKDAASRMVQNLCSQPTNSRNFVQGWLGYCERNGHNKTVESLFEKYSRSMLCSSSSN